MQKIRPLFDRVYIERIDSEEKTKGGLYIPEGSKEKGQTGKIIAIGTGKYDEAGKSCHFHVKVGDVVFFGKYAGTDFDDKHVILKEDDILGIIQD